MALGAIKTWLRLRLERGLATERAARVAAEAARRRGEEHQAIRVHEEFLAIAAHELRTPVTSLQLALQTVSLRLKRERLVEGAPQVARMLDLAERKIRDLDRLVEKLLEVSTMAGGSLELSLSEVDLAEAVRSAVAGLREPLRASGSALTLDGPEPLVGRWDRTRVEQVVTHLLSNAIKYGHGRPIAVHTRAEDGVARLVVEDHGLGIAREAQARIFGRFERAASLRQYGGLGLGLYVVKQVVERLGGRVECASVLDSGSTFTVTLPRRGPSDSRASAGAASGVDSDDSSARERAEEGR
jgi:signal transduction histidine kinase